MMGRLWNVLKFTTVNGTKLGLVGGAGYLTVEHGVWGNAKQVNWTFLFLICPISTQETLQGEEAWQKIKNFEISVPAPEFPPELRLPVELPDVSLPAVPAEVTSAIDTVSSSIETAKSSAADTRKVRQGIIMRLLIANLLFVCCRTFRNYGTPVSRPHFLALFTPLILLTLTSKLLKTSSLN